MPIPRGLQTRPSLKLPYQGAGAEVAVIGDRRLPWTEFGSNAPKIGKDGKQRQQLRITGIVVSQSGANVGNENTPRQPDVGEVVDLYLHGHNWGSYIDAEKAFRTAGLEPQVGDIMLWHYTHDEQSQHGNPKKMRNVSLRRPRPEEQWALDQAEKLYYSLGFDRPDVDPGPADIDDDPFPATGVASGYPSQAPQQPAYGQQQPQQPAYGQQGGYAPASGGSTGPGF